MARVKKRVLAKCGGANQIVKSHVVLRVTTLEGMI
jgi:hypothetical protein